MSCLARLDRLLDVRQDARRKKPPRPPAVFEKVFADAPDAHYQLQIYQLPDAPPPPKLPPPPLKEPLSLPELLLPEYEPPPYPPPDQPPLPRPDDADAMMLSLNIVN